MITRESLWLFQYFKGLLVSINNILSLPEPDIFIANL